LKPGNFRAVRPPNWDEIIVEDDDNDNWADPRAPHSGRSCPDEGNDNENGEGEENWQGGETRTSKRKGMKDRKGKQKTTEDGKGNRKSTEDGNGTGKNNGNGKRNFIVKQTPEERQPVKQWNGYREQRK